jgi:hypothetical protein
MRIKALVIYQVVTLSGGNISWGNGPDLCSKVLGVLISPSPFTALPVHPEQRVTGCGEAALVTGEEICRWVNGQPSFHPAEPFVLASVCSCTCRAAATIRQQFLFTLLEDCSFFAHLVLRCVRGGDGSPHGVAVPRGVKPRLVSGSQRRTQPVIRSYAQRELDNLSASATEMSLPELETLWAEVASRHVRISGSEGGTP